MKKVSFFAAIVLLLVFFVSCGNAKWLTDFEEGKALAEKQNKSIFVNFTADSDELSPKLDEIAFKNQKFLNKYSKYFVFVNLDFSKVLKAEQLNPDASEEETILAQKVLTETKSAMEIAEKYGVRNLPSSFILSSEGYVITQLEFFEINPKFDPNAPDAEKTPTEDVLIIDDNEKICKRFDEAIVIADDFKNNLKIAKSNASIEDRVMAIDEIFDNTDFVYRYLLADLNKIVVDIDKENISGSVGKHLIALANSKVIEFDKDYQRCARIFEETAQNDLLSPDEKQIMYYQAALILYKSKTQDNKVIKDLIQKGIDISPESEKVEFLQNMIKYIDNSKN